MLIYYTVEEIFTSSNIAEPVSWLISNMAGVYTTILLPQPSITLLCLYLKDICDLL